MEVVAFAGLVVEAQDAKSIHHVSQAVLQVVRASGTWAGADSCAEPAAFAAGLEPPRQQFVGGAQAGGEHLGDVAIDLEAGFGPRMDGLVVDAHQHAIGVGDDAGAARFLVGQRHLAEAVGRREHGEFHLALAPGLEDSRVAAEDDVHVRADVAFLDDAGSRRVGAFLGAAEQVADFGRAESVKGLDMLGEPAQQALQVGFGELFANPAHASIIPGARRAGPARAAPASRYGRVPCR